MRKHELSGLAGRRSLSVSKQRHPSSLCETKTPQLPNACLGQQVCSHKSAVQLPSSAFMSAGRIHASHRIVNLLRLNPHTPTTNISFPTRLCHNTKRQKTYIHCHMVERERTFANKSSPSPLLKSKKYKMRRGE